MPTALPHCTQNMAQSTETCKGQYVRMHTCTYDGVRKHVCMDNVICTVPGCLCSESVRLQQALVKSHSLTDPSPEVVASRSPLEERMITDHVTGGWNIRWMEGCMGEPVGMTFTSHQQLTAEEEEKETMRERESFLRSTSGESTSSKCGHRWL